VSITKSKSRTRFKVQFKMQGFCFGIEGCVKDEFKWAKIFCLWNESFFVAFNSAFQIGRVTHVVGAITKLEDINVVHAFSLQKSPTSRKASWGTLRI